MNIENLTKLENSDIFKTWNADVGHEGWFQALSRHWCGEDYTGPLKQHYVYPETSFK